MQKCLKTIGSDDTSVVSACALYFEKKVTKIHARRIPHLHSVNKKEYVLKCKEIIKIISKIYQKGF